MPLDILYSPSASFLELQLQISLVPVLGISVLVISETIFLAAPYQPKASSYYAVL
jgi:hypothetical protein